MKNYARIENGIVKERLDAEKLPPFHPSLVWVECENEIEEGWELSEGSFSKPKSKSLDQIIKEEVQAAKEEVQIQNNFVVDVELYNTVTAYLEAAPCKDEVKDALLALLKERYERE